MDALLGNSFVKKGGETVDGSALAGKVVGLYFSAHWCPPCRQFTPMLASLYTKVKAEQPFEIVFVSSDKSEGEFNEYLGTMPWLALPFADRQRKNDLSKKFGVQGIPMLVIVDAEGKLITSNGREAVMEDPKGFPWRPIPLCDLLAGSLRRPDGSTVDYNETKGKPLGIYFSAHWCPPCKMFTPQLASVYENVKKSGRDFEIIFVSGDKSEGEFNEYHGTQPWLAIPFADEKRRSGLNSHFEVEGIPSFVMLDGDHVTVINKSARGAVTGDPQGANFPWVPPACGNLNEDADGLNEQTCLIALIEGADDGEQATAKVALTQVAEKHNAAAKAAGEDPSVKFFYSDEDGQISSQIWSLTKLKRKAEAVMILLDIPSGGAFYVSPATEVTVDSVDGFLEAFKAGALERRQLSR